MICTAFLVVHVSFVFNLVLGGITKDVGQYDIEDNSVSWSRTFPVRFSGRNIDHYEFHMSNVQDELLYNDCSDRWCYSDTIVYQNKSHLDNKQKRCSDRVSNIFITNVLGKSIANIS